MNHTRILTVAVFAALAFSSADAQNIFGRLADRAKNAAENAIGNKIENEIYNAIENGATENSTEEAESESPGQKAPSTKQKNTETASATWDCLECGATGNTGKFCAECGAKKPASPGAAAEPAKPAASAIVWNNYDFVAGDEIIFEDNLENEQMGEFPSKMDLFQGNLQVVTIDGIKSISSEDGIFTPFFDKPYLTDEFTIEFDVYIYDFDTFMKNHPDQGVGINNYAIELASTENISRVDTDPDQEAIYLEIEATAQYEDLNEPCKIYYEWYTPAGDRREGSFRYELHGKYNCFHHVAISFNKRACKIYFDEQRVANIPNAKAPKWVQFAGSYNYPNLYFWKNFRIAKGAVPLYDRLQSDGRIVTYGITFDTGKATIKPESAGEINRIKNIMEQDPSIAFEVQGHCDSTGSAAVNDKLSQQRAEAIVARLVELGISKSRLTAVGMGSKVPVADNSTDEGRAKNRRVEFVKK